MSSKSNAYWRKREAEALKGYIKDEKEYDKQVKKIYQNQLDAIQTQINAFYGTYAAKEGITIAEAKKRVSKLDIAEYERKAAKYVKEKNFSAKANEEMRLYNATMKINRLEMLKANIGLEMLAGTDELDRFMSKILKGRTEDELKRQAGILGKTIKNNARLVDSVVNASFHNATFSDRIWTNQALLRNRLSGLLQSGMIQGKNPRVLAREIKKEFNTSTYNAERLMRTELARVQTEAQKQSFKRNGFEQYEFIANASCCGDCQALNGKHFYVKDMMPGENAAPIHPNCRCSVAAWEDDSEYEAWLDYLDKGGTTENWEKIKKTIANSGKGAIMQSGAESGAQTNETDPFNKKREKSAADYYEQVRNRNRTFEIAAVAKNTGYSETDIDTIFSHIFELEHLFRDGTIHRFFPDYYMQHSWMRLREGKNIQPHDLVLLMHELAEAKIMGKGTDIVYEDAHEIVEKTYNYKKALIEYLKTHDA